MALITSIVHEFTNFMEIDKSISRQTVHIHPSVKILMLVVIDVMIAQFLSIGGLLVLVAILLACTTINRHISTIFFRPFAMLFLFSILSSVMYFLVNLTNIIPLFENFTLDSAINNPAIKYLLVFNMRIITMMWAGRVFFFSTPMTDLLYGLRVIKVPKVIVNLIGITYRYIFVLADEFLTVSIAKELRAPASRSIKERFKELSMIYAATFNRALLRGTTVQLAVSMRGSLDTFAIRSPKVSLAKTIAFFVSTVALVGFLVLFL